MSNTFDYQNKEDLLQNAKNRFATDSLLIKLEDASLNINWRHLQKYYFPNQSLTWFYDRLFGKDEQGNLVEFTSDEKKQLKLALKDLAKRINSMSELI